MESMAASRPLTPNTTTPVVGMGGGDAGNGALSLTAVCVAGVRRSRRRRVAVRAAAEGA